jgi:type I restriction enzyme S subunit
MIRKLFTERKEKVSDVDYPPLSVGKRGTIPQMAQVAKAASSENRRLVLKGDYAINSRSDRRGSSGLSEYDGSVSLIYHVLTPHDWLNGRFAHYLLRSHYFVEEFYRNGRGIVGDLWTTRYLEMRQIILPLPPGEEQTQIVRWLDWQTRYIDKFVRAKKREIECLQELRRVIINNSMLQHGEGWRTRPFSKVAKVCANLVRVSDYSEFPQISPTEIEKNTGKLLPYRTVRDAGVKSDHHKFFKGQILYSKIRPMLNKVTVAPFDGLCCADMYPIETKLVTKYLMYFMLSDAFLSQLSAAGNRVKMPKINREELSVIQISYPDKDEQTAVAAYLDEKCAAIDRLIAKLTDEVNLVLEYKTRIISDAVTGKIDLRDEVIPECEEVKITPTDEADDETEDETDANN